MHESERGFPYQRLSTYPRFETEARGNSEMAYCRTNETTYTIVIDQSNCQSRACPVVMETRNASRIESDHNFALSDQTSDLAGDCLFKREKLFPALSLYYNVHYNITLLLGIFLDISETFWDMQRI